MPWRVNRTGKKTARLFAVSVRFPQALAREVALTPVQPGVYEVHHFTGVLRLVVVHELPQQEHNALLHLFSARSDLLRYGAAHYRPRSEETSSLLLQLFTAYRLGGIPMPDSLELLKQFAQETKKEFLNELTPEERLEGLSPDELLAALSPEMRAALVVLDAGAALFVSALAQASGLGRDHVLLATNESQAVRLALALCAAGLERDEIESQFVAILPHMQFPRGLENIAQNEAFSILAADAGSGQGI